MALFRRRVLDVAGTHPHIKVYLNGSRVPRGFKHYMSRFTERKNMS